MPQTWRSGSTFHPYVGHVPAETEELFDNVVLLEAELFVKVLEGFTLEEVKSRSVRHSEDSVRKVQAKYEYL